MQHQSQANPHNGPLAKWARFAVRKRAFVLIGWVIALVLLGVAATTVGGQYADDFTFPGTESQRTIDLLGEKFPGPNGETGRVVFETDGSISDPDVQQTISGFVEEARTLPQVEAVVSPYDAPNQIAASETVAFVEVQYGEAYENIEESNVEELIAIAEAQESASLDVSISGALPGLQEIPQPGAAELIGIALAMIIMVVMFGSVVAMGLPIVTAIIGVGMGLLFSLIFADIFTMTTITTAFVSMIGLGVGIDYALFIVNRYRDALLEGETPEEATVIAIDTSGRAVVFAGLTVAIAMLGLRAIGIPFVTGLGVAGSLVVLASVLIAVFLMPSLLGLVGNRVLRFRVPGFGKPPTSSTTVFGRLGNRIKQAPGVVSAIAIIGLLILAVPYFSIELGLPNEGSAPEESTVRQAYDTLAEGFGPGFNGPLVVLAQPTDGSGTLDLVALDALVQDISQTEDVAFASPPQPNPDGDAAIIQVIPVSPPDDTETSDLVTRLRDDTIPDALGGSDLEALVGGQTAANIDLSTTIQDRMPLFFAVVIGLSMILLTAVFRSIVVPVKAALLNLLSIGASFGALVAVFQWGWLANLIGVNATGPIASFLPMDYEVFLVSRVREEYTHGYPARRAMLQGLNTTGRIIAAAGAIMVSVFFAFVLEDDTTIKSLGFGLGFAILVDAFIIRLVLLPAVMLLLGKTAWYIPGWLDRLLPTLDVEGSAREDAEDAPQAGLGKESVQPS